MKLTKTLKRKNEHVTTYRYRQIDEATGECVSTALICMRNTRFASKYIPTMTVADVSTKPDYRNRGLVREMLNTAHSHAEEYGAYVSVLHPFSFSFYKKFGYERISNTVSLEFPISALDFLPCVDSLKLLGEENYDDILSLFECFSENRNLMFSRPSIAPFLRKKAKTYLYYADNQAEGYITIEVAENELTVKEMAYLNKKALENLVSFLRSFQNEVDIVKICDIAPIPELDELLRHYTHTSYKIVPDLAARILNTKELLLAYSYPIEYGRFTIKVEDTLDSVSGIFEVEYENGSGTVERLNDSDSIDIILPQGSLIKILYGYDGYTAKNAQYLEGVRLNNEANDFFRAFPKRINGLFEHF